MSDRPCYTPGCPGIGYHPASHPHPLKWCLPCLVTRKRERRHAKGAVVDRTPFRSTTSQTFSRLGPLGSRQNKSTRKTKAISPGSKTP
jgi:hypothetical protein